MADADQSNLTTLTIDLLSAYVANNTIEHSAIPDLIKSTHAALKIIDSPEPPAPQEPEYKPAVSVRQSLKSDTHLISLIDGKPYQTLKRHLKGHNLTPDEYRARYGLPKSYPMVAPAYSAARREIAKKLGLGNRGAGAQAQAVAPAESKPTEAAASPLAAPAPKAGKRTAPKAPEPAAKTKKATSAKAAAVSQNAKGTAKAPAKSKAPAASAPATAANPAETPVAVAPTKPAPRTRKAATPKAEATASPATPKAARGKRPAKAAEPAS